MISLDWVIVEVSPTGQSGTWTRIFYWGDHVHDAHTNIPIGYVADADGEADNEEIPLGLLFGSPIQTGIAIDVDLVAAAGAYQFVRIYSPLGGDNDPSEVDAVQLLLP
jgi:hypothetical protein